MLPATPEESVVLAPGESEVEAKGLRELPPTALDRSREMLSWRLCWLIRAAGSGELSGEPPEREAQIQAVEEAVRSMLPVDQVLHFEPVRRMDGTC